jgi:hypothetical protein
MRENVAVAKVVAVLEREMLCEREGAGVWREV